MTSVVTVLEILESIIILLINWRPDILKYIHSFCLVLQHNIFGKNNDENDENEYLYNNIIVIIIFGASQVQSTCRGRLIWNAIFFTANRIN